MKILYLCSDLGIPVLGRKGASVHVRSLVAAYTPRRRRSFCYGLSFTVSFGIGALGASLAGFARSDFTNYLMQATLALLASGIACALWFLNRPTSTRPS